MEWWATECRELFHQCDAGELQARIDRESFWGQSGRAYCARQAILFLRQRMDSDCAAYRHSDDGSERGVPTIRLAATSPGWSGLRNRFQLSGSTTTGSVLSKNVFPLRKRERDGTPRAWLSLQCRRQSGIGQSTEWKWLRKSAKRFALQR